MQFEQKGPNLETLISLNISTSTFQCKKQKLNMNSISILLSSQIFHDI